MENTVFGMATIGKVLDVTKEIEWKIPNFFSLPEEKDKRYDSPSFLYADESWYLYIYPNGHSKHNSTGHIDLFLGRKLSTPPVSLAWTFHLKTCDGKKHGERQCSPQVFDKKGDWGRPKFLARSELSEKKSELVPSDVLTLVCTLQDFSKTPDKDDEIVMAECPHCEVDYEEKCFSCHERKCLDQPIRCPACQDVVELRKWLHQESQQAKVKATEKLADDLAGILVNEEHSDVTITVKDDEFRLHRNILAGRNPYFSSMFKTEMKEKSTGIVSIDDCDPDSFRSFIHFVYTGKVNELSLENVCDLYTVADKYREDQLKAECLCFMRNEISVERICDFIVLALIHNEKELLKDATEFFCRNTQEVIQSVKWQNFMKAYSTQANELYLKAYQFKAK